MKRPVCVVAFFLLFAAPLFALHTNLIDDVIRMSRSGVGDEVIIEFVQASRERLAVTAGDIIAMKNAGVSQQVISTVIAKADATGEAAKVAATSAQPPEQTAAPRETTEPAAKPDEGACLTFDPPISLVFPFYGPWFPPKLWDPYWYMPRLDTRSGPPAARGGSPTTLGGPPAARSEPPAARERPDRRSKDANPSHQLDRGGSHSAPSRTR